MARALLTLAVLAAGLAGAACSEPAASHVDYAPSPSVAPAPSPAPAPAPSPSPSPAPAPAPAPSASSSGTGSCPTAGARLQSPPVRFDLYAPALAPDAPAAIDPIAEQLRQCPGIQLEIQVHTDTVRTSSFNARSSQRIAELIRDRLVASGIDASRLAPCGYGESRPLTGPDWSPTSTNMRVEWHVVAAAPAHVCPQ